MFCSCVELSISLSIDPFRTSCNEFTRMPMEVPLLTAESDNRWFKFIAAICTSQWTEYNVTKNGVHNRNDFLLTFKRALLYLTIRLLCSYSGSPQFESRPWLWSCVVVFFSPRVNASVRPLRFLPNHLFGMLPVDAIQPAACTYSHSLNKFLLCYAIACYSKNVNVAHFQGPFTF